MTLSKLPPDDACHRRERVQATDEQVQTEDDRGRADEPDARQSSDQNNASRLFAFMSVTGQGTFRRLGFAGAASVATFPGGHHGGSSLKKNESWLVP